MADSFNGGAGGGRDTAEAVRSILRSVKGYEGVAIGPETNLLDDLHFESIEVMNLILALEQAFHITFEDKDLDMEHFITLAAILDTLRGYGMETREVAPADPPG